MKTLLKGLGRAKARTILNAIIILSVTISVGIVLATPFNFGDEKDFKDAKASTSQSPESKDSTTKQTESQKSKSESRPQITMQKPDNDGFSTMKVITLSGIAIVGAGLLILVNLVSTNRRKEEIAQINANGISMGEIKKQFFKEALVTVLCVGIIGSAVATFVSRPISNAIFKNEISSSHSASFGENSMTPPSMSDGNFTPPSNDNSSGSFTPPSNDNSSGNFTPPSFDKNGKFDGNNNYLLIVLTTLGYTVVLSLIAGAFCALPIKKDKKENDIYIDKNQDEETEDKE